VLAVLFVLPQAYGADEQPNPHWDKQACRACHQSSAPAAGNAGLNTRRAEMLCEGCHDGSGGARPCRHVSDIPVGDRPIPDGYAAALESGRLVCTTCHDPTVQCLAPNRSYRFMNPGFVRDRTSRERGEHCFKCHDNDGFERLNPHAMQAGDPAGPTCTLCHATMPVKDERGWLAVNFNVSSSLNNLCTGCHDVSPHPGNAFSGAPIGWEHLAVPSAAAAENMRRSEQVLGLILPLDPNSGEVHCATCHNPHPGDLSGYPVARTPGSKSRLRVDDICQACHDL
jgi:hypothetical protein